MVKSMDELHISKILDLVTKPRRQSQILELLWNPPPHDWCKVNMDGSSFGNPGEFGVGGVIRSCRGQVICAFVNYLGVGTCYFAEVRSAIRGLVLAKQLGFRNILLEIDSSAAAMAMTSRDFPWVMLQEWRRVSFDLSDCKIKITHYFLEVNMVANKFARKVVHDRVSNTWSFCPDFMTSKVVWDTSHSPRYKFL
ncbi:hypothetical protein NE237_013241 [Protea cynaroides]|uniref:RNase H type-1 domain-containing protein n=1 Tax=Protea cynaroides TaxID=273540 RepID=A0A9Q0GYY9_9MAGN|nr:hypothetical protein NE237_013241 [Protea cynaroides]